MFEMSLRGQVPINKSLAVWGHYGVDMRNSNRLPREYASREYFNQSISGGITCFLDLLKTDFSSKKSSLLLSDPDNQ
jgi:hypothetical protein